MSCKSVVFRFMRHVDSVVFSNLGRAELGGVTGVEHKIKAYLNVAMPNSYPGAEV